MPTLKLSRNFFRAAMDEEESSHIDSEDGNTLIILDSPIVAKPDENITYTTVPVGIILTQKTVITISMQEKPCPHGICQRGSQKGCRPI